MKVFISWSGQRSRIVAELLRDWLPHCIQQLDPWISTDIDKGAQWFEEVQTALTTSKGQGIFCVTPENASAPWLNFEAGYVASGGRSRIRTLLIDLGAADLRPP